MRTGLVFDFWYPTGPGAASRRPYLIFYHVEDDSKLGAFYWCDPDQRKLISEKYVFYLCLCVCVCVWLYRVLRYLLLV
jgi:hypothetical protein